MVANFGAAKKCGHECGNYLEIFEEMLLKFSFTTNILKITAGKILKFVGKCPLVSIVQHHAQ